MRIQYSIDGEESAATREKERGMRLQMRNKMKMLLLLTVCLLMMCVAASAEYTVSGKTISVSGGGTAIQDAIDYIQTQSDRSGWTITVANGTYKRFTIPHYNSSKIEGLTIEGASESGVVVDVLKEAVTGNVMIDKGGINLYGKNITLRNMTVQAGTVKSSWDAAAISTNNGMVGGKNVSVSIENCTITGPGVGNGAAYGIFWACERVEVKDSTISGFSNCIEYMNDGFKVPAGETYEFTGNTITDCSFAFHGYMGGGNGGGKLVFADNHVVGTPTQYAKVIAQDNTTNSFIVDIRDNMFENVLIGLVNLQDSGDKVSDVIGSNSFSINSCYIEAIEPGTIDFYTVFEVPEYRLGYWALTGKEDFDVDWGKNPDGSTAYIQQMIDEANRNGSNRLALTGIDPENLVKTFTWFKDGIYWYDYVGGLEVLKKVIGTVTDEKFTFTVTLNDRNINATYGDMTFVDGVATFTLGHGESIYAEDMPAGLTYTITEERNGKYITTATGATGTITKGEVARAEFINAMAMPVPINDGELPETGDSSSLTLWFGLMALSFMAIVMVGRKQYGRR